jgi:Ca2+-binding RTX toxin-like protein
MVAGDGTNAATNSSLYGGQGGDSLFIGAGSSTISLWGDLGSDTLNANGSSNNNLKGGDGNDSLFGGATATNNTLDGGLGDDALIANNEIVLGGVATGSQNSLWGGEGNDTLIASGQVGTDPTIHDILVGGAGDDFFWGSSAADTLGGESDRSGSDTLYGGGDADSLIGSSGFDGFYYANSNEILDTITSFQSGTDKIYLSSIAFGNVVAGTTQNLATGAGQQLRDNEFFTAGTNVDYITDLGGTFAAGDDAPAIVFDRNSSGGGTLYWDWSGGAVGDTATTLTAIATIESGRVQASDIVIF